MTDTFKRTLKSSIVLHIMVITVFLVFPALTRCVKRNKNEDIPPDLIIPILPSAPVPQIPQPAPEPPRPEPPPPEPPKPEPEPEIAEPPKKREIKVNTNRIVRKEQPPPPKPQAPVVKVEDLEESLLKDLPVLPPGAAASSGNPTEMGIYHGKVYSILYRAWDQPPGVGGLRVEVTIRIARNGAILNKNIQSKSGSPLMDQSVNRALNAVSSLPPLPVSFKGSYYDLEVTFRTTAGSM